MHRSRTMPYPDKSLSLPPAIAFSSMEIDLLVSFTKIGDHPLKNSIAAPASRLPLCFSINPRKADKAASNISDILVKSGTALRWLHPKRKKTRRRPGSGEQAIQQPCRPNNFNLEGYTVSIRHNIMRHQGRHVRPFRISKHVQQFLLRTTLIWT